MIRVDALTVSYGERPALRGIDLEVPAGSWHAVLGPNGSGKSTLFRVLATLLAPGSGHFSIGGASDPAAIRRQIGVVFQSQSLDRKLSVAENLTAQGNLFGLSGRSLAARIAELLDAFGLTARRHDPIHQLSGGLARRVEIAKALLHQPRVLLLDEPSTGLDPAARRDWWEMLTALGRQRELTVLLTTHLLDEADRCDRLTMLLEGRIAIAGAPAALRAEVGGDIVEFTTSDPPAVAAYTGGVLTPEGTVRVETPHGARLAAATAEALPGLIQALAVHQPTLEDVFFRHTGVKL